MTSHEGNKIDVLDHGFVRLVECMGSDLSIVRNARNSYNAAWRAGEDTGSDSRLLNFLWKNKHTTPFESVTFTFEVKAPIMVFRQWHRHRTQSYNELSARYKELPEEYYLPSPELIGQQHTSNKQMRLLESNIPIEQREKELEEYDEHIKKAFELYRKRIGDGWPRELARGILPVFTYSNMFVTLNLLNLLKFLSLRSDEHAQYEIQVYANAMQELIEPIVPVTLKAWKNEKEVWKKFQEWEKTNG